MHRGKLVDNKSLTMQAGPRLPKQYRLAKEHQNGADNNENRR